MENLKIRVNSEAESKEAQELFFELNYNWFKKGYMEVKTPETIMSFENGALSTGIRGSINHKEITLPDLRDMVVLNRNDVGDATHEDYSGLKHLLLMHTRHVWGGDKWLISSADFSKLKPIEKPMKEYLRKNSNGTYSYIGTVRPEHVSDFMIEIPEGAEIYIDLGFRNHSFYKDNFKLCWCGVSWENTVHNSMNLEHWNNTPVLWKRHTLPEELPFIDDEPLQSLNDQYAEIEKVRQDSINSPSHYADSTIECIDAMEAMMTPEQFIGYLRGNVFKYQWRYEKKNGIEDLKKAQWYLERLTEKVAEKNAPF